MAKPKDPDRSSRPSRRQHLGPYFSEGARLLWEEMFRRGWKQADLAHVLDAFMGRTPSAGKRSGVVARWLYGDRQPNLTSVLALQKAFEIDPAEWGKKATKKFVPPSPSREPLTPEAALALIQQTR